jgi:hypothetical protein
MRGLFALAVPLVLLLAGCSSSQSDDVVVEEPDSVPGVPIGNHSGSSAGAPAETNNWTWHPYEASFDLYLTQVNAYPIIGFNFNSNACMGITRNDIATVQNLTLRAEWSSTPLTEELYIGLVGATYTQSPPGPSPLEWSKDSFDLGGNDFLFGVGIETGASVEQQVTLTVKFDYQGKQRLSPEPYWYC